MKASKSAILVVGTIAAGFAAVGLTVGIATVGVAQTVTKEEVGELAENVGYLVDGKTFKVVRGNAKGDVSGLLAKLGAKEVGPGVIIFRSNNKVYIAEAPKPPAPQAMKDFQDSFNVSYMKAQKDFQDNFNVSYMKNFQDNFAVSYMKGTPEDPSVAYAKAQKDFQDQWNVSYMKAMKDFQDNWNTSYMKNAQDNWNVSYMKQVKDFQDNWNTSYMK